MTNGGLLQFCVAKTTSRESLPTRRLEAERAKLFMGTPAEVGCETIVIGLLHVDDIVPLT
jgi:hypothetical protein